MSETFLQTFGIFALKGRTDMERHAYLIMAHNQFSLLEKLLRLLDDEKNDIYIHLDKKVKEKEKIKRKLQEICQKSDLFFIASRNVMWASWTFIEVEVALLEAASKREYAYCHLLSGVDFPLKTQKEIHEFFHKEKGKEFIHFGTEEYCRRLYDRYQYYYPFQNLIGRERIGYPLRLLQNLGVKLQRAAGIRRQRGELVFYGGSNWFSITGQLAKYVVSQKEWIRKTFGNTLCCDEVFLQTLVMNSPYKKNLYHGEEDNDYRGNMRYIDWNRGDPYTFRPEDYEDLLASPYLFARKMDEYVSGNLTDRIFEYLEQKRKQE